MKNRDKLDQFIYDNRSDFDMFEPGFEVWDKIQTRKEVVRMPIRKILWRAAAILILLGGTVFSVNYITNTEPQTIAQTDTIEMNIPEIAEAETYYTTEVEKKLKQIEPHFVNHPDIKLDLQTDLTQLDSIYMELKNDLKDGVANREVIDAMIQNYRIKLQILEDLQQMLETSEKENSEKNQTNAEDSYSL